MLQIVMAVIQRQSCVGIGIFKGRTGFEKHSTNWLSVLFKSVSHEKLCGISIWYLARP